MIQKYYNSILEQVFAQIGKKEHNIVLAKYSNDFSLKQLEISEQITNNKKVHFAAHEFRAEKLSGAYEPFLDLIFELFDQQKEMTFDEFLDKCNVYSLQRPIIAAYRETGKCIRKESLLYTEVDYERSGYMMLLWQCLLKFLRYSRLCFGLTVCSLPEWEP